MSSEGIISCFEQNTTEFPESDCSTEDLTENTDPFFQDNLLDWLFPQQQNNLIEQQNVTQYPQPSTSYEKPNSAGQGKYSTTDPRFIMELESAIQNREDNRTYSQETIDRCKKITVERYRSRKETISKSTISNIRTGSSKIGSVKDMLEKEEKMREEAKQYNTSDLMAIKQAKERAKNREKMSKYRKKPAIASEEEINIVAHRSASGIVATKGPKYNIVFQIFREYYKKRLPEKGIITRSKREIVCRQIKGLLENILEKEEFYEITSRLLKEVSTRINIRWRLFNTQPPI